MIDKSQYQKTEIPENLNTVVHEAISEGFREKHHPVWKRVAGIAAAFMLCVITFLNASPTFAKAAYEIPVVGEICRIFTFREYHFADEFKYIDAEIPQIENTGKSDFENRVNLEIQKVMNDLLRQDEQRAKDYYDAFVATGGDPKDFIPLGITVEYEIKHIDRETVSFVISHYETHFNGYNRMYYSYNLDVESGRVLTLRDILGNNYREIVADSIENTISGWDEEKKNYLWDDLDIRDMIHENTNFYINEDGLAVVVFEKYEIAAGVAGTLEFAIDPAEEANR